MRKNLDTLRDRYLFSGKLAIFCLTYEEKIELLEIVKYRFLDNKLNRINFNFELSKEDCSYIYFKYEQGNQIYVNYFEVFSDKYNELYLSPSTNTLTLKQFKQLIDSILFDVFRLFPEGKIVKAVCKKNLAFNSNRIHIKGFDNEETRIGLNNFNNLIRKYRINNSITINKLDSENMLIVTPSEGFGHDLIYDLKHYAMYRNITILTMRFLNDFYMRYRLNPIYNTINYNFRMD